MKLDTRGISIGISRFLLTLAVGAIVIFLVTTTADSILPGAQTATTNATANQGTTYMQQIPDLLPIVILLFGFFGIIVLAVYQREVR